MGACCSGETVPTIHSDETKAEPEEPNSVNNKQKTENDTFFVVTTQDQTQLNIPLQITTLPDYFGESQVIEMKPLVQYFEEATCVDRMDDQQNSKSLDVVKNYNILHKATRNIKQTRV
eukprot:1022319_1